MKPKIIKKTTRFHLPISPEEKLVITLRFLATGETCKSLMYQYRVSELSVSRFVPEVESFMEKVLWRSICLYQTLKKNGCLWQRNLKRNGSFQIVLGQLMGSMFPWLILSIVTRLISVTKAFSVLYCLHWLTPTVSFCMSMQNVRVV